MATQKIENSEIYKCDMCKEDIPKKNWGMFIIYFAYRTFHFCSQKCLDDYIK